MKPAGKRPASPRPIDSPDRAAARPHTAAQKTTMHRLFLLLALIATVVFSAVAFFGSSTGGGFGKSASCIKAAYDNTAPC